MLNPHIALNSAYSERNRLIAVLAHLYPSSLELATDHAPGWNYVVIIDFPTGQGSWHIPDSELPLFNHVKVGKNRSWDGHSTEQKYERLHELTKMTDETIIAELNRLRESEKLFIDGCKKIEKLFTVNHRQVDFNDSPHYWLGKAVRFIEDAISLRDSINKLIE